MAYSQRGPERYGHPQSRQERYNEGQFRGPQRGELQYGEPPQRSPRRPQPSVITDTMEHALYLWIYLHPNADPISTARDVARLQDHVNLVTPQETAPPGERILAGVGFGKEFYSRVTRSAPVKSFHMLQRKHGDATLDATLPATGGDIFIHAKCNSSSKLFELCQQLVGTLGKRVKKFEDVYGFTYLGGRDLSGFPYGMANASSMEERATVAVEGQTGGSYVLTQRWEHLMRDLPGREKFGTRQPSQSQMEAYIGRHQDNGEELAQKHIQSHVSRMRGGNAPGLSPNVNIYRQGQPYGAMGHGSTCGLFFLGYSNDPNDFEYLLERMAGYGRDGHIDMIFNISRCVSGNIWYFPGMEELDRLLV